MHITLALVAFRLISVVPHQVVKLIGVQPANRVDMDQFGKDVGMVGMGASMRGIEGGARNVLSSAGRASSGGGQRLLGNGGGGGTKAGGSANGVDTTMSAQSDITPPATGES